MRQRTLLSVLWLGWLCDNEHFALMRQRLRFPSTTGCVLLCWVMVGTNQPVPDATAYNTSVGAAVRDMDLYSSATLLINTYSLAVTNEQHRV